VKSLSLLAMVAASTAFAAIPKDAGYALSGYLGKDGGVGDGGMPFSGFELGRALTAKGDLSKDDIKAVVKAGQPDLNACYHDLIKRTASGKKDAPAGTANLSFEVSPEGKGGLDEAKFAECVVGKVKAWVFPPPRGGGPVKVTFPVKLLPPD
jgi:hypothetical protein